MSLNCQIVCNSQIIVTVKSQVSEKDRRQRAVPINNSLSYDKWKEQNQGIEDGSMQMIDVDVEIHASSFTFKMTTRRNCMKINSK